MTHTDCVNKLKEIGWRCGFAKADGKRLGKIYHLGNPDCVWYYDCKGKEPLMKIAEGDRCNLVREKIESGKKIKKKCNIHGSSQYLPLVAFEVPNSENEKSLRGSLMTLQLTNASASIIVLIGKSADKYKSFAKRLVGRYSSARFRIWTEKDVNQLYANVVKKFV